MGFYGDESMGYGSYTLATRHDHPRSYLGDPAKFTAGGSKSHSHHLMELRPLGASRTAISILVSKNGPVKFPRSAIPPTVWTSVHRTDGSVRSGD